MKKQQIKNDVSLVIKQIKGTIAETSNKMESGVESVREDIKEMLEKVKEEFK